MRKKPWAGLLSGLLLILSTYPASAGPNCNCYDIADIWCIHNACDDGGENPNMLHLYIMCTSSGGAGLIPFAAAATTKEITSYWLQPL
jgi:hypothetical protein